MFQIDAYRQRFLFSELVDREQFTELLFKVIVINGGVLAKSHSVPARIKINDLNDNTPVLSPLFYNTEIAIPANSGNLNKARSKVSHGIESSNLLTISTYVNPIIHLIYLNLEHSQH